MWPRTLCSIPSCPERPFSSRSRKSMWSCHMIILYTEERRLGIRLQIIIFVLAAADILNSFRSADFWVSSALICTLHVITRWYVRSAPGGDGSDNGISPLRKLIARNVCCCIRIESGTGGWRLRRASWFCPLGIQGALEAGIGIETAFVPRQWNSFLEIRCESISLRIEVLAKQAKGGVGELNIKWVVGRGYSEIGRGRGAWVGDDPLVWCYRIRGRFAVGAIGKAGPTWWGRRAVGGDIDKIGSKGIRANRKCWQRRVLLWGRGRLDTMCISAAEPKMLEWVIPLRILFESDDQANNQGYSCYGHNEGDESYSLPTSSTSHIMIFPYFPQSLALWTCRIPKTVLGRWFIEAGSRWIVGHQIPMSVEGTMEVIGFLRPRW